MKLFNKIGEFLKAFFTGNVYIGALIVSSKNCVINKKTKIAKPYNLHDVEVEFGSYISLNSRISHTKIGKFCSIGPNFFCGFGIHPTNGISTSPVFYSSQKQAGFTYSEDKIEERKEIFIGNDVFIGANVTILDGISIGNGAIIGAGAVVSKDIPPYAIAVGAPIKIIKFRFKEEVIDKLQKIEWWNRNENILRKVEKNIFDVDGFLKEIEKSDH